MGSSETFCLKWDDFLFNTTSSFIDLRREQKFADVTLALRGNKTVGAHKVVLASGSQFFKTLLTENKHPHPLIYMRNIQERDLIAVVDFLYYGEVNILQENLDNFLNLADELQLKGLSGPKWFNNHKIEKDAPIIIKIYKMQCPSQKILEEWIHLATKTGP